MTKTPLCTCNYVPERLLMPSFYLPAMFRLVIQPVSACSRQFEINYMMLPSLFRIRPLTLANASIRESK